jgi:uncharacterized protein (DUF1778 family)
MARSPKKKPMGRPKKLPGEARDAIMHVRLTAEERALLDAAARVKALDTSAWMRSEMLALARTILGKGTTPNE